MRSRGETAIQQSWEEIIQFFAARGCAGTVEEIKRVVLNRIQGAKILGQAAKVTHTLDALQHRSCRPAPAVPVPHDHLKIFGATDSANNHR